MKKFLALLLALVMIVSSLAAALPVFADTGADIDTVVAELSQLYYDENAAGKTTADSAASRLIVKANIQPDTYGFAKVITGTDDVFIYQYETANDAADALKYYQSLDSVEWAETDSIVEAQSLSYGNYMVGGDEAKEYVSKNGVSLSSVNVALIDTGVLFTNELFSGRVVDSGVNLSDTGDENTAVDANSHGSHVASIIVDNTTDNVQITAYRVLNYLNKGSVLGVATCIMKAVNDGADIINLSITTENKSELLIEAVKSAYAEGVVIVNSAGNASDDVANYYPANMDEVFTVGSVDCYGNRAAFSNFGDEIDFVAPGFKIEMTGYKDAYDERYPYGNGTSYSAAYVTAAAAMVLSAQPGLGVEEVRERLIDSCVPMESLQYYDSYREFEEYDTDTSWDTRNSYPQTDEECYGSGMPQILKAAGIAPDNSPVEFSVQSGTYHEAFELVLTADEGSQIYYTTEDVYPTPENATLYTEPIEVSETMSVRAIAVSEDKSKSAPAVCEYLMAYYADESDFEIDERGYITDYTGDLREMVVPETIDGITVKGVADRGMRGQYIRTIIFPDSVEELEDYSLYLCDNIKVLIGHGIKKIGTEITWSEIVVLDTPAVETIGELAFIYTGRKLYLPELREAGDYALAGNKNLMEVNLPKLEKVNRGLFQDCYVLRTARLDSVKTIDVDAFANCFQLKYVYAPQADFVNTGWQDYGIFNNCINLNEADFPNATTIIGSMFNYCRHLNKVNLPNVVSIGYGAFSSCDRLTQAYIPNVETIGGRAFSNNNSLEEIIAPKLKSLDKDALIGSGIKFLYAPELESAQSMPTADKAVVVLSSKFTSCPEDNSKYDLIIYGTPGTFAQTYANENDFEFIALPILVSEPPMEYTDKDTDLAVEVWGFNKTYQWYGAYEADNTSGVIISGATQPQFNPADFKAYPYYYCVITCTDGDYQQTITTGTTKDLVSEADYSSINSMLDELPDDMSVYTSESAKAFEDVLNGIEWNLPVTDQKTVDDYAAELKKAIDNLEYLPADLSGLNEAVSSVPADLSGYTQESVNSLNELLKKAAEYQNADITMQSEIDSLAAQIYAAVDGLTVKAPETEPSSQTQDTDKQDTDKDNNKTAQQSGGAVNRDNSLKSPATGSESGYILTAAVMLCSVCVLIIARGRKKGSAAQ